MPNVYTTDPTTHWASAGAAKRTAKHKKKKAKKHHVKALKASHVKLYGGGSIHQVNAPKRLF